MSARIPVYEKVGGKRVACYDSGPEHFDRYTVVYLDYPEHDGLFSYVGMNGFPTHPHYGFGQHGSCRLGRHLGKRILFADLPEGCRKLVEYEMEEE